MDSGTVSVKGTFRRLAMPLWGLLVFSVLTISGLVFVATHGQDRNAIQSSEHLAHAAIAATERTLSALMFEYSYWDQAVENLVTKFDHDWADENIGPYLLDTYDLSSSYVLGKNNQVIFSSTKGGRGTPDPLSHFSGGLEVLISKARLGPATAAPEQMTGIINASDRLYFASVPEYWATEFEDDDSKHEGSCDQM